MSQLPKTIKLPDGNTVPTIGLGSCNIQSDISEIVYNSIKNGIRLIDTAACYGSEEGVGKGIKKAIDEGLVKREDLFVVTKIACSDRANPEKSIQGSLSKLGLKYVDLYLDHWPKFFDYGKDGTKINLKPMHILWPEMESLVEKGYAKYIGVSNYNVQSLCNLLSFCKIKPLVNEIEYHPYLMQNNLVHFCNKENILIFAYNPLVKGWYCKNFEKETNIDLLGEEIIKNLSEKYKKTPGQIVLNWIADKGFVPIPMTSNPKRMKENLESLDFKMDTEDIKKIDSLNKMFRFGSSLLWEIYSNDVDVFA